MASAATLKRDDTPPAESGTKVAGLGVGAPRRMSAADYLAWERRQPDKHEFHHGEVFAMAGGSHRHNFLSGAMVAELRAATRGKGLYPFTRDVAKWVTSTGIQSGLLTIFVQHTSASLVIQENADPDVVLDLADYFERLAPENDPRYRPLQ